MILIDKELVDLQLFSSHTRYNRFPVRTSLSKNFYRAEQQQAILFSIATNYNDNFAKSKRSRKEKSVKCFSDKSARFYYNFIFLDQTESVVIARNNKDRIFVAIKRVKKSRIEHVLRIPDSVSNYVVNIKDMFVDNKEIVIIYKQINILLRHIITVTDNLLQAFEIAAVYKKVRLLFS